MFQNVPFLKFRQKYAEYLNFHSSVFTRHWKTLKPNQSLRNVFLTTTLCRQTNRIYVKFLEKKGLGGKINSFVSLCLCFQSFVCPLSLSSVHTRTGQVSSILDFFPPLFSMSFWFSQLCPAFSRGLYQASHPVPTLQNKVAFISLYEK